jgi:Cytochrome P460
LLALAVLGVRGSSARDKQDKYTPQGPGGLAFSKVKGYEDWQVVAPTLSDAQNVLRVIVANPVMINAYRARIPGNGKPFPDGSKIVKIEWRPKRSPIPLFPRAPRTLCRATWLRSNSL